MKAIAHSSKVLNLLTALPLGAVVAFGVATPASADEAHHTVTTPDSIQWGAAPPSLPRGAQAVVLAGNPGQEGPFVLRLKFPAGYIVPPHRHSKDELVTVMAGKMIITGGEKVDRSSAQPLQPASFVQLPAGMAHYAVAEAESVVQINGMGPFDVTYVNPKDDPRAKQAPAD